MTRILQHARANVIAYLALFVALGGTSYAALQVPAGSVGAKQIQNHSIAPVKFNPKFVGASVRYWAVVDGSGRVLASSKPKPKTFGFGGSGQGQVLFGKPTGSTCYVMTSVNDELGGFASSSLLGLTARVSTYDAAGALSPRTVALAVLCGTA